MKRNVEAEMARELSWVNGYTCAYEQIPVDLSRVNDSARAVWRDGYAAGMAALEVDLLAAGELALKETGQPPSV